MWLASSSVFWDESGERKLKRACGLTNILFSDRFFFSVITKSVWDRDRQKLKWCLNCFYFSFSLICLFFLSKQLPVLKAQLKVKMLK